MHLKQTLNVSLFLEAGLFIYQKDRYWASLSHMLRTSPPPLFPPREKRKYTTLYIKFSVGREEMVFNG